MKTETPDFIRRLTAPTLALAAGGLTVSEQRCMEVADHGEDAVGPDITAEFRHHCGKRHRKKARSTTRSPRPSSVDSSRSPPKKMDKKKKRKAKSTAMPSKAKSTVMPSKVEDLDKKKKKATGGAPPQDKQSAVGPPKKSVKGRSTEPRTGRRRLRRTHRDGRAAPARLLRENAPHIEKARYIEKAHEINSDLEKLLSYVRGEVKPKVTLVQRDHAFRPKEEEHGQSLPSSAAPRFSVEKGRSFSSNSRGGSSTGSVVGSIGALSSGGGYGGFFSGSTFGPVTVPLTVLKPASVGPRTGSDHTGGTKPLVPSLKLTQDAASAPTDDQSRRHSLESGKALAQGASGLQTGDGQRSRSQSSLIPMGDPEFEPGTGPPGSHPKPPSPSAPNHPQQQLRSKYEQGTSQNAEPTGGQAGVGGGKPGSTRGGRGKKNGHENGANETVSAGDPQPEATPSLPSSDQKKSPPRQPSEGSTAATPKPQSSGQASSNASPQPSHHPSHHPSHQPQQQPSTQQPSTPSKPNPTNPTQPPGGPPSLDLQPPASAYPNVKSVPRLSCGKVCSVKSKAPKDLPDAYRRMTAIINGGKANCIPCELQYCIQYGGGHPMEKAVFASTALRLKKINHELQGKFTSEELEDEIEDKSDDILAFLDECPAAFGVADGASEAGPALFAKAASQILGTPFNKDEFTFSASMNADDCQAKIVTRVIEVLKQIPQDHIQLAKLQGPVGFLWREAVFPAMWCAFKSADVLAAGKDVNRWKTDWKKRCRETLDEVFKVYPELDYFKEDLRRRGDPDAHYRLWTAPDLQGVAEVRCGSGHTPSVEKSDCACKDRTEMLLHVTDLLKTLNHGKGCRGCRLVNAAPYPVAEVSAVQANLDWGYRVFLARLGNVIPALKVTKLNPGLRAAVLATFSPRDLLKLTDNYPMYYWYLDEAIETWKWPNGADKMDFVRDALCDALEEVGPHFPMSFKRPDDIPKALQQVAKSLNSWLGTKRLGTAGPVIFMWQQLKNLDTDDDYIGVRGRLKTFFGNPDPALAAAGLYPVIPDTL